MAHGPATQFNGVDPLDQRQHRQLFGWYPNEKIRTDHFLYSQVGRHFNAAVCRRIAAHLMEVSKEESIKYLPVFLPIYNETKEEFYKTLLSIMVCADFIKKARFKDNAAGLAIEHEFQTTRFVLVPIFDGVDAISDSCREWLDANFPDVFDDVFEGAYEEDKAWETKTIDDDLRTQMTGTSVYTKGGTRRKARNDTRRIRRGDVVVQAACRKWWFYSRDLVPPPNGVDFIGDQETFEDHLIPFYMFPIVKKVNRRKYNSHSWFFDSVCLSLSPAINFCFLTSCGITYSPSCLAHMFKELCVNANLIGATARERSQWPNKYFHPCETSYFPFLKGRHKDDKTKKPCWKCYLNFLLGPSLLQAFEQEVRLLTSIAAYNLVEAVPAMSTNCTMYHWQKIRHFQVIKEYFSMLFKGEINKKSMIAVPAHYNKMIDDPHEDEEDEDGFEEDEEEAFQEEEMKMVDFGGGQMQPMMDGMGPGYPAMMDNPNLPTVPSAGNNGQVQYTRTGAKHSLALSLKKGAPSKKPTLDLTEFLRTIMRLAEDRVLSFTAVFSTRYGTAWVPGAVFYSTPCITYNAFLLTRRRELNGSFAAFHFCLISRRVRQRVNSRTFDDYSFVKATVTSLWRMQSFQLFLMFIAPAIFGAAGYAAMDSNALYYPEYWGWARQGGSESWVVVAYLVYTGWIFYAHYAPNGLVSEVLVHVLAMLGLVYISPIYWALGGFVARKGITIIPGVVIFTFLTPIALGLMESLTAAKLYINYLPYFFALVTFSWVFVPAYSLARFYDTAWVNAELSAAVSVFSLCGQNNAEMEHARSLLTLKDPFVSPNDAQKMRRWNFMLLVGLVTLNFIIAVALIRLYQDGQSIIIAIMFVCFLPVAFQLIATSAYWAKTIYYRNKVISPDSFKNNIIPAPKKEIDVQQEPSQRNDDANVAPSIDDHTHARENRDAPASPQPVFDSPLPPSFSSHTHSQQEQSIGFASNNLSNTANVAFSGVNNNVTVPPPPPPIDESFVNSEATEPQNSVVVAPPSPLRVLVAPPPPPPLIPPPPPPLSDNTLNYNNNNAGYLMQDGQESVAESMRDREGVSVRDKPLWLPADSLAYPLAEAVPFTDWDRESVRDREADRERELRERAKLQRELERERLRERERERINSSSNSQSTHNLRTAVSPRAGGRLPQSLLPPTLVLDNNMLGASPLLMDVAVQRTAPFPNSEFDADAHSVRSMHSVHSQRSLRSPMNGRK